MWQEILKMLLNQRGEVAIEPQLDDDGNPTTPPPGANQELEDSKQKIQELEEKNAELEREKKGIYGDLKSEQASRRQVEEEIANNRQRIQEEEDKDPFAEIEVGEDEYVSGKAFKKVMEKIAKASSQKELDRLMRDVKVRTEERVIADESRMQEMCELNPKKYPVPYDEAIEAFVECAKNDPSLWQQYDSIKLKPGGRPAEFAYKIALREHDKYKDVDLRKARESLVDQMRDKENQPRKLATGSGAGAKRLEDMTDNEISQLSDEDLERASRGL